MQDRVTVCYDADEKNTLDWLFFFFYDSNWMSPWWAILFPVSVSLTLTNIIEVVKNR